jgi:hypothetical protein
MGGEHKANFVAVLIMAGFVFVIGLAAWILQFVILAPRF